MFYQFVKPQFKVRLWDHDWWLLNENLAHIGAYFWFDAAVLLRNLFELSSHQIEESNQMRKYRKIYSEASIVVNHVENSYKVWHETNVSNLRLEISIPHRLQMHRLIDLCQNMAHALETVLIATSQ